MISPATAGWIRKHMGKHGGQTEYGQPKPLVHTRFDLGGVIRIGVDPNRFGKPRGHYVPPSTEVFRKGTAVAKVITQPDADPVLGTAILLHEIGHMICSSRIGVPGLDPGGTEVEKRAWAFAKKQWRRVVPEAPFPADTHWRSLASYHFRKHTGGDWTAGSVVNL
jgi:hypothetical protein